MVTKGKDGRIRVCVDLKVTLNPCIKIDHYPLPRNDDIFNDMVNWKILCLIDLSNTYLQISLEELCRELLTITTS